MFTRIILKKMLIVLVFFVGIKVQVSAAAETAISGVSESSSNKEIFTKERWGADYFNYMNGPTFSESNGGSINHYLTLKHKFNSDWALSFTFREDENFGNNEPSFALADSFLRLDYPMRCFFDNGTELAI